MRRMAAGLTNVGRLSDGGEVYHVSIDGLLPYDKDVTAWRVALERILPGWKVSSREELGTSDVLFTVRNTYFMGGSKSKAELGREAEDREFHAYLAGIGVDPAWSEGTIRAHAFSAGWAASEARKNS